MYDGREIPGRVIAGPLSVALSGYLGRAVRLFKRAAGPEKAPVWFGAHQQAENEGQHVLPRR
jgi:hypothetical protein